MFNFNYITKENIPDHPYSTPNITSCRFWICKSRCVINLINHAPDIDKIYLHAKIHMKQNINC